MSMDDLTARVYGRLVVIDLHGLAPNGRYLWACVCECGAGTVVAGSDLKSGHTTSCGCARRERFAQWARSRGQPIPIGQRFGALVTTAEAAREQGTGRRTVHVRCDCGRRAVVRVANLLSGNTRSCGCMKLAGGQRHASPTRDHYWRRSAT